MKNNNKTISVLGLTHFFKAHTSSPPLLGFSSLRPICHTAALSAPDALPIHVNCVQQFAPFPFPSHPHLIVC